MKTLHEKIENAGKLSEQIRAEHPEIDGLWFHFEDCSLDEMRKEAEIYNSEVKYAEAFKKMQLYINHFSKTTIWCYSKVVKVETHFVIDTAIKNI